MASRDRTTFRRFVEPVVPTTAPRIGEHAVLEPALAILLEFGEGTVAGVARNRLLQGLPLVGKIVEAYEGKAS